MFGSKTHLWIPGEWQPPLRPWPKSRRDARSACRPGSAREKLPPANKDIPEVQTLPKWGIAPFVWGMTHFVGGVIEMPGT